MNVHHSDLAAALSMKVFRLVPAMLLAACILPCAAGLSPGLVCNATDTRRAVQFTTPTPHFTLEPHQSIHPQLESRFTAEWTGLLRIPHPGSYSIHADAPVWIDGQPIEQRPVRLEAGDLPIRIRFERPPGRARLQLRWESEFFPVEPIPASAFFHRDAPAETAVSDQLVRGRELLESLGCVACHRSSQPLLKTQGAPDLSDAGRRLKPEWIFRWLENPRQFQIESGMPALPHSEQDRADLTAFLSMLKGPERKPENTPAKTADDGRHLFARIGCAACHTATELPLAGTGSKYHHGELFRYLRNPLHGRPGTRNPDFGLNPDEAAALAVFLGEQRRPEYEQPIPAGDPQRGRELVGSLGCANCHSLREGAGAVMNTLKAPDLESLDPRNGCLAERPATAIPRYALSSAERSALAALIRQPDRSEAPLLDVPRMITRFRCQSCHDYHGPAAYVGGGHQHPSSLTEVGNKFKPGWFDRVLHQRQRVRPWLELRMPHYGDGVLSALSLGFPAVAGADLEPATPPPQQVKIRAGAHLLGTIEGGLSCINCHDCLGEKSPADMRGPDLAGMHERLRADWLGRWLREPSRIAPGTAMPAFFGALPPAEAEQKISVITAALAAGRLMPPPPGLGGAAADFLLTVSDAPIVLRGFLPDSSPRSIAVGLPGGVSFCFDAETCRLRYAWFGEFLNMRPTWHGRGASPPELRGKRFFVAPDLLPIRVGEKAAIPTVQFLGYALLDKLPEFRFAVEGIRVTQIIEAAPEGGLLCRFEIAEAEQPVWLHVPEHSSARIGGEMIIPDAEGWMMLPPTARDRRMELRIPGPGELGNIQAAY
jgi:mono/diheme cytochrome c family protein